MKGRVSKDDKEFHLRKITYVDYKLIEMDRVLTMLFPRLKFGGYSSRRAASKSDLHLDYFIEEFFMHDAKVVEAARALRRDQRFLETYLKTRVIQPEWFPELNATERKTLSNLMDALQNKDAQDAVWFEGLHNEPETPGIIRKWIETDLMDVVNRGKPNQAIAAPRPLHGNTYKFRNAKHTRDYGAAEQIYWMLNSARGGRGQTSIDTLKKFFFTGLDTITDRYDPRIVVDVETQALLHLDQQITRDTKDSKEPERYPPICVGQADLMADDVLRLMAYQNYMPRSVLVDYLKVILAFHLALYHLKLFKLLPSIIARGASDTVCTPGRCISDASNTEAPLQMCPYRIGILMEMGDTNNKRMVELARQCWDMHSRRVPGYIQSHLTLKKLDEMALYLNKRARLTMPAVGYFSIEDLLDLLTSNYSKDREEYFSGRLIAFVEANAEGNELDPELRKILELGLSNFDTYVELLVAIRSNHHRDYITQCLDAFCLKNTDSGILRQPRVRGGARYFSLGSRLLEVLLQIAVLQPDGNKFSTREIRIEELLSFLRSRYGIYIDRLPVEEHFSPPSIIDQQALRKNVETFKTRLREIGFFRDLSDAYYTQTVTSRYTID